MSAIRACVERRALPREPEQRPESFGPIALDPLAWPLEPCHVVLEGAARTAFKCAAQLGVGQLRVMVGHTP